MKHRAGRISFTTVVLLCLVGVLVIGIAPIMDFLYATGLYSKYTQADVLAELQRQFPDASFQCEPGRGGWDFVCEGVHKMRTGKTFRVKHGIQSSWMTPVARNAQLLLDQPTPSAKDRVEGVPHEQTRVPATLDLNRARVDQLKALPGVDDALAYGIAQAVIHKRFTSVDDLLTIQGVDRQMLERIRPLVHMAP